jgi:transposase-like protein
MKTVYTSTFKAQVVLELLKEEKSLTQLAAAYKVSPNVLREWRTATLKNLASLFERGDDVAKLRLAYEQQLEDLYAQIGRLTTQLAWIKKKSGLDPDKSGAAGDGRTGRA